MTRPNGFALLFAGLVALSPLGAKAEEKFVDVAQTFPLLAKFYAAPAADRSLLAVSYFATRDGKPAPDFHGVLMLGGKRTPIVAGTDGKLLRLPTPAEFAAHAQFAVDAPPSVKYAMQLSLDTAIPPALEVSPITCEEAIEQANKVIQRAAGVAAVIAPQVKAVTFVGAGSGVAVLVSGGTAPLPLIKGSPAYAPDAMKSVRSIKLARRPTLISLE